MESPSVDPSPPLLVVGTTIAIVCGVVILFLCFFHFLPLLSSLWSGESAGKVNRDGVLLLGLPGSGKTSLFAQLTLGGVLPPTCTSMMINEGEVKYPDAANILPSSPDGEGDGKDTNNNTIRSRRFLHDAADQTYYPHPDSHAEEGEKNDKTETGGNAKLWNMKYKKTHLIDHPGHRRLFPSLIATVARAKHVILVVDAVTIHDDQEEGVNAIAELLCRIIPSREFYGVQSLLIACTKRDDMTSYSSKAVRKLLESALTICIQSRRGELGKVEEVIDGKGEVVKRLGHKKGKGTGREKHYILPLAGDDKGGSGKEEESFSFASPAFPIPVYFADISSVDPKNSTFWYKKEEKKEKAGDDVDDGVRRSVLAAGPSRMPNGKKIDVEGFSLLPVIRFLAEQT